MTAADCTIVRRLMFLTLPVAGLIALIGLSGQPASGRIATDEPLAAAARALPRIAVAQAAPVRPLRFTIVDSAGAAVRRWPGGPAVGTMAAASHSGVSTRTRWASGSGTGSRFG